MDMRWPAALAFRPLGVTAEPAIHELEIRAQATSGERSSWALFALSYIGPAAVPSIAGIFSNQPARIGDKWTRVSIINLGTNARPLIALMVSCLDDTNEAAAATCANTLGQLRMEPDIVIPALIRKLGDPRDNVRVQVSESLADFKILASTALPELTNALSDPNMTVRKNATNAIASITGTPAIRNPFE
jgi:HEAT repeat protein